MVRCNALSVPDHLTAFAYCCRMPGWISTVVLIAAFALLTLPPGPDGHQAWAVGDRPQPIASRNLWMPREQATQSPLSEADQAIVDGWRLYRTQRGQEAFNHAMATLEATDGLPPAARDFKGCTDLRCHLVLPALTSDGWIPAGRLWVSPKRYVLIVHSPRDGGERAFRRRSRRAMRYFIFHEFHNQTRNTDPYDTISAHRRSVFVPFYMSKPQTDAHGNEFVTVIQVAPHNVASRHATNLGHAGPGLEVANNYGDRLRTLQAYAGILVAMIVKQAEPRLEVVRHRGIEGLPMLRAYYQRRAAVRDNPSAPRVRLPFIAAAKSKVARAAAPLTQLLAVDGLPRFANVPKPTLAEGWRYFKVPEPQLALRPPSPEPVLLRPPSVTPRPAVAQTAAPLTMDALIARILGTRDQADRVRNCEIAPGPDCPG